MTQPVDSSTRLLVRVARTNGVRGEVIPGKYSEGVAAFNWNAL